MVDVSSFDDRTVLGSRAVDSGQLCAIKYEGTGFGDGDSIEVLHRKPKPEQTLYPWAPWVSALVIDAAVGADAALDKAAERTADW